MKRIPFLIPYFLLFVLYAPLSSCFSYEEVEITDIKSIKFIELSNESLTVESTIKLLNKNSYDIDVVKSDFEVFVKDIKIGNAHLGDAINVGKNSEKYYTLKIKSNYKDLSKGAIPKLIAITAFSGNQLPVKVDGYVVGKVFLFKKKYHFVKEENVPLDLFQDI